MYKLFSHDLHMMIGECLGIRLWFGTKFRLGESCMGSPRVRNGWDRQGCIRDLFYIFLYLSWIYNLLFYILALLSLRTHALLLIGSRKGKAVMKEMSPVDVTDEPWKVFWCLWVLFVNYPVLYFMCVEQTNLMVKLKFFTIY